MKGDVPGITAFFPRDDGRELGRHRPPREPRATCGWLAVRTWKVGSEAEDGGLNFISFLLLEI